jgi:hypothetical protein
MCIPTWISSTHGIEIAREVRSILREKSLENRGGRGDIELFASDITDTITAAESVFFGEQRFRDTKTWLFPAEAMKLFTRANSMY